MSITDNQTDIKNSLSLKRIRLLTTVGTLLLAIFMLADLALLPENLAGVYWQSRVAMQFPLCGVFLLSSFHPLFLKYYQRILCVIMLGIVYINYWLIVTCWELAQFSFPYEGTVMYSLFTLFVFRQSFKYGVIFSCVVIAGFALILASYPIYGAQGHVNLGFVIVGSVVGLLGVQSIESALKKLSTANNTLEILSQTDHLTGLYNRRTYESRFAEQVCLNKRTGNAVCIFVIDLDYFKDYNDGYGHAQGDKVIKMQADHLTSIFRRESDIVARFGGEEFVVVASQVSHEKCVEFAKGIIDQWLLKKLKHGKGKAGDYVTCSAGFYVEEITKDSNQKQMFKYADMALYQAKSEGRNRFVEYKLK